MRTIVTPSGSVKLMDAPVEVLRLVRGFLPFGAARFATPQHGADYGLVMQCGTREVYAIKQQHPDFEGRDGQLLVGAWFVLIGSSLASFARRGFGGMLMPCAYRKEKGGGREEVGIAYFGRASHSGPEAQNADEPEIFVEQFGQGFFGMIKQFIQSLVESSARTGIPILQDVIIGMDVRKRSELGNLKFGFLVVGTHIVYIRPEIVESEMIWDMVAKSGATEVYHMPSIPVEISEAMLATAKPTQ
jgi:hypothetical protein